MKLVMTLLVRNEADIVEANLDYHLAQGVDFVIVTDHGSSDSTPELLRRYERAGAVAVIRDDEQGHYQSLRVTRMAQLALTRHSADWVIHNDADEFWWPLSGSLRDVFASIPAEYGQIEVQRRDFFPCDDGTGPFYSRLIYRDTQSLNPSGRPLEPKVAHRAHPDVVMPHGNHSLSGADLRRAPASELLEIFHFPMRSYEQFERKVVQTGLGHEKVDPGAPEVGRDQRKLMQVYRENGLREYYENALSDDTERQRGLANGTIMLDRRLENFMRALPERHPHADRPDGQATRTFITRALSAVVELDTTRQALAHAQVHAAALEQDAASLRTELAATGEALQSVRGSRLVRWTAPLRRVWYRRG
jgi:hypothetical protein